jgi:hypothetical protein
VNLEKVEIWYKVKRTILTTPKYLVTTVGSFTLSHFNVFSMLWVIINTVDERNLLVKINKFFIQIRFKKFFLLFKWKQHSKMICQILFHWFFERFKNQSFTGRCLYESYLNTVNVNFVEIALTNLESKAEVILSSIRGPREAVDSSKITIRDSPKTTKSFLGYTIGPKLLLDCSTNLLGFKVNQLIKYFYFDKPENLFDPYMFS